MQKSTDPLHELIHKLDKNEKRHFHLMARMYGQNGEAQHYVQLFDLIAAQKTYDENAIKAQLSNKVFAGNISGGKHFLYNLILRCLRHYHAGANLRFRLREMWMDAHLLRRKGLLSHSLKILDKAMKIAREKGMYASYIDLSDMKRYIALDHENQNRAAALQRLAEEDRKAFQLLGNRLDIIELYERAFTGAKDQTLSENEWKEIYEQYMDKLAIAEAEGQVYHDMLFYYLPKVQYQNHHRDYAATYAIDEKIINYLQNKDDTIIRDAPERYFAFLTNFFNICTILNKTGRMEELIGFMEKVPPANKEEKIQFQNEILYCRVILYILLENHEKVIRIAPEAKKILQLARKTMIKTRRWAIAINIGASFMHEGKYDGALDWFDIVYQERDNTTVPLNQYAAFLGYYVCHLELGSDRFLDAIDKNIVTLLRRQQESVRNAHKNILFAFRRYRNHKHDKEAGKRVLQELIELTEKELRYAHLTGWAKQKLSA